MTMNHEVRDRWVAALRSGEYVQGTGKLARVVVDEDVREHCCLGVLCDLAVRARVVVDVRVRDDVVLYDGQLNYLPASVQEWAGLGGHGSNPHVRYYGSLRTLGTLNDTGVDFNQIAQLIEEYL
jgi:hypothetical protein